MLSQKNIIVTGALGHLGTATCQLLSLKGANVYGLDLSSQNKPFKVLKVDLCSVKSIEEACRNINPDALVNIAGGFALDDSPFGPCKENWEEMFKLNVTTLTNTSNIIIPKLIKKKKGSIVNIGATSALKGAPKLCSYVCAKSAVMRITETLAEELTGSNIRVNAISPSIIDTPANRLEMPDADSSSWTKPEDIAEVISFLCSESSSCISGTIIPV